MKDKNEDVDALNDAKNTTNLSQLEQLYNVKWIKKNLVVLSFVFFFNFLAYSGLATLQVSIKSMVLFVGYSDLLSYILPNSHT